MILNIATDKKQERIEALLPRIEIERDGTGLYAIVPSTTREKKNYFIDINESTYALGACQCEAAQKHMECIHILCVALLVEANRRYTLANICDSNFADRDEATQVQREEFAQWIVYPQYRVFNHAFSPVWHSERLQEELRAEALFADFLRLSLRQLVYSTSPPLAA